MTKVIIAAIREYKTTALTKAFLFGAVIFPLLIWGAIIAAAASGIFSDKKDALKGTVGIIDTTQDASIAAGLAEQFDSEKLAERAAAEREQFEQQLEGVPIESFASPEQIEQAKEMVAERLGIGLVHDVEIEMLLNNEDEARERVGGGDLLALVIVGEHSLRPFIPPTDAEDEIDPATRPGQYAFFHAKNLDSDYIQQIRGAVRNSIQSERYRRASIDPVRVAAIHGNPPRSVTRGVDESGEEQVSGEDFSQFLPLIFMMLLFTAVITGGQYLLMGTLEEKGSRVMEVLLSAVSPLQLLIGKLVGQGVVGLTILVMYSALGIALTDRFGYLSLVPMDQIPLLLVYFLMAYAFLGSMMVAVGAAVTEIREAQALYAPITISMMLPFLLMIAVMQNPASVVVKIFSYFPPTTPFVMVMRLSQAAHPVPMWEVILSIIVGFAGVAVVVWGAAKIFRVGVLMYGTPPSLFTLLKWIRYA